MLVSLTPVWVAYVATTHRVRVRFTAESLRSASCWKMTAVTHTKPQRQSAAQNRKCIEKQDMKRQCLCWRAPEKGGGEQRGRRNETESKRENVWRRERGKKSRLIQTLRSHVHTDRRPRLSGLCCGTGGGSVSPVVWLCDCMTHPSPSFSRTSKTSSGCLVRLSSLSFFSCL